MNIIGYLAFSINKRLPGGCAAAGGEGAGKTKRALQNMCSDI
jgi:hypothetical protein